MMQVFSEEISMLAIVPLVLFQSLTIPDVKVTLPGKVQSLTSLLRQVSASTHVQLTVDQKLANEQVFVSCADATLSQLMKKLSSVTSGNWSQAGETFQLAISQAKISEQQRAESKRAFEVFESAALQATQVSSRKELNSILTSNKRSRKLQISALAFMTNDNIVARIASGERIVLSTQANGSQIQMTDAMISAIKSSFIGSMDEKRGEYGEPSPQRQPDHAYVVFNWLPSIYAGTARLVIEDKAGANVHEEPLFMVDWNSVLSLPLRASTDKTQSDDFKLSEGETPIMPSPEVAKVPKEMQSVVKDQDQIELDHLDGSSQTSYTLYSLGTINGTAVKLTSLGIRDPVAYEPLDWSVGPILRQLASSEKKDVVALVPDSLFAGSIRSQLKHETLLTWLTSSRRFITIKGDPGKNWIEIQPQSPDETRRLRISRPALKSEIEKTSEKGYLTLAERTGFATNIPRKNKIEGLETTFANLFSPALGSQLVLDFSPENQVLLNILSGILAVHGKPTQQQVSAPITSLPMKTQNLISWFMMNTVREPDWPSVRAKTMRRFCSEKERTNVWPRGYPANSYYQLMVKSDDGYYARTSNSALIPISMSGWSTSIGEDFSSARTSLPHTEKYIKAQRLTITLRFGDGQGNWWFSQEFDEPQIQKNSPSVLFGELPDEIRERILAAEKSLGDMLNNRQNTNGGAKP